MPFIDLPELTLQAVEDCLGQTLPTRVLLIDQGSSKESREAIDNWIDARGDQRVLCWHHLPPLPSLSATWNRALNFVWEITPPVEPPNAQVALVVNNDVRLHPRTYESLLGAMNVSQNLFVSAVGVKADQFDYHEDHPLYAYDYAKREVVSKGGPDFSCFLISRAGHEAYPFDESFIPCYTEDLDMHRRYMLGGDGHRIFSVNLPFLHYASGTLKSFDPATRAKFNAAYAKVVEHYAMLWGGKPNHETYTVKGDPTSAREGVTTPELQRRVQAGEAVLWARLEDLDLAPDPHQRRVDDFLQLIEDHLTEDYEWARDTLEGIKATVERTNRVTVRQQEAVEHIILGRLKHDSRW